MDVSEGIVAGKGFYSLYTIIGSLKKLCTCDFISHNNKKKKNDNNKFIYTEYVSS